ncbi:hypothetical protein ACHAXS_002899, partial [Conticribra weissflogii]
ADFRRKLCAELTLLGILRLLLHPQFSRLQVHRVVRRNWPLIHHAKKVSPHPLANHVGFVQNQGNPQGWFALGELIEKKNVANWSQVRQSLLLRRYNRFLGHGKKFSFRWTPCLIAGYELGVEVELVHKGSEHGICIP